MSRKVIFYKTVDGKCPIKEYLDSLSDKDARKISWTLSLLEEMDIVPAVYFKKLEGTEAIWECRIRCGSVSHRIFCFFTGRSVIVLTNGFLKKGRKAPKIEIRRAELIRREYIARRKG